MPSRPGRLPSIRIVFPDTPRRRVRIAFLIRSLGPGGAERQLAALAAGLHRRGHEVAVITYYPGDLQGDLTSAGVPLTSLGKRSRWDLIGPLVRLRREMRRLRPQIVHGYMPDANLVALIAGRVMGHAKVVWGVRASFYDFRLYGRLFRSLFGLSVRLAGLPDLIIYNSRAGRDAHVAAGYRTTDSCVIPNGIDSGRFRPDSALRAQQREAWGLTPTDRLIGMVGRLDRMKDHQTFLRSFAAVAQDRPELRATIIGDGPADYLAELQALAAMLGTGERIHWVGHTGRMVAAYNAMDLLVSSSASGEGFSNVIGEAMACGVRAVVTAVGDSAEVVGPSGLVVPPSNVEALAEAIARALEHPPEADPRQRVEECFSIERLVLDTEAALLGLFAGSRAAS